MNKVLKVIGLIIVLIIVFSIAIYFSFNHFKPEETNETENTVSEPVVVDDPVEKDENVIDEVDDTKSSVENKTEIVQNTIVNQKNVYDDTSTDTGATNKKEEAIALVKQKWGNDDTVSYRVDSVKSNGEYVVAVVSKAQAKVLNYFVVNLETKTVNVDY